MAYGLSNDLERPNFVNPIRLERKIDPIRLERIGSKVYGVKKKAGFRDFVPKDHQYEMVWLSNSHVTDDVT